MKSFAKITMNSLKTYSDVVQQVEEFSSVANDALSDFDNLIEVIGEEINGLEEKNDQLKDAESIIKEKISEYEARIEETQSYIEEKEADLDNIRSELAITDEYISYYDDDGNYHEKKNRYYSSLERQEVAVERKLARAYGELEYLERRLSRCYSLENELSSVHSAIETRISVLINNKNAVGKNKNEYGNAVSSIRNHTVQALSKLSMIGRCLNNYSGVQVRIVPAYETAYKDSSRKTLDDLEYMTPRFQNAPSREKDWTYRDKSPTDNGYFEDGTRELQEDEKLFLKDKLGWSDDKLKKCTKDKEGIIHYKTDRCDLDGKTSENGVPYERRRVEISNVVIEGVFPKFESVFNTDLALEKWKTKAYAKECNEALRKAIANDQKIRNKFTSEQINDIEEGRTPIGYVWHHNEEPGKMQLVKKADHDRTIGGAAHTGGNSLWGADSVDNNRKEEHF